MALDITGILNAMVSHALSIGYFDQVNQHESKQSAFDGLTCQIWIEQINPVRTSGLSTTSIRIQFEVRLYNGTMSQPYDDTDSDLAEALDALMRDYIGDFTLGGLVRHVDVFGAYGPGVSVRTGFMNQDGKEFRVFSVNVPVIVDDLWDQAP
jgi:hypothetical protein